MRVCIYICIVVFNVYHASSLRNKLYNIISLLAKKVKDLVPSIVCPTDTESHRKPRKLANVQLGKWMIDKWQLMFKNMSWEFMMFMNVYDIYEAI